MSERISTDEITKATLPGWQLAAIVGIALLVAFVSGRALEALAVAPAPLTGHHLSLAHYDALRALTRREGPPDVVAIGSSVFRRAVVPGTLGRELARELGASREARVYNFGAVGHNALTYPMLTALVLRTGAPRVIVFLITPRSVDATARPNNESAEVVAASPYAEALRDGAARRALRLAWLDHAPVARFGPSLRAWLTGELDDWRAVAREPAERGYFAGKTRRIGEAMRRNQREIVATWRSAPPYVEAVDRAVRLAQAAGSRVMLVDAPRPQALLEMMDDPSVNVGGMRDFMRQAGARLGVPVATVPDGLAAADEYADLVHLLPSAAERYTRWLAARIAEAYPELSLDR